MIVFSDVQQRKATLRFNEVGSTAMLLELKNLKAEIPGFESFMNTVFEKYDECIVRGIWFRIWAEIQEEKSHGHNFMIQYLMRIPDYKDWPHIVWPSTDNPKPLRFCIEVLDQIIDSQLH